MRSPKTTLAALLMAGLLPACNEDMAPAPPALGPQIDRMGRAGVNTAITDPFNLNSTSKGANQDRYNAAAVPAQWAAQYRAPFAASQAVLDSLDTVCGNQLLAGPAPVPGRYDTLATVLADDQIYVNSSSAPATSTSRSRPTRSASRTTTAAGARRWWTPSTVPIRSWRRAPWPG